LILTAYPQQHPSNPERRTFLWRDKFNDSQARAEYIYRHFFQHLFFLVDRQVKCSQDSEDIVMNVIVRVAYSQTQPHTLEHLRRRLYVSVRNESITYYRRRIQHQKAVGYLSCLNEGVGYSGSNPSEKVQEKIRQLIFAEIARLPPQRRKILHLYFFAQKSTGEISKQLSISAQTVLNHKAKALQDLRNSTLIDHWRNLVES
jgi:RNA polymerase sigma factor (sigma-70 family)